MAYMIKSYGVLRPDEWRTIYISDSDNNVPDNYINVDTKKMYIKNHKTKSSLGTREYELDEHICSILKYGIYNYLVRTSSGHQYSRSDKLNDAFKKYFNYSIYDYRRAVVSLAFASKDVEKIKKISSFNGHDVNTMLQYYNKYIETN